MESAAESASNWSRFDHWKTVLSTIRQHYAGMLQTYNHAVRLKPPPGSTIKRSIGVTRVLDNYYKPSAEEQAKIAIAKDPGTELSTAAWRHSVDQMTYNANFVSLTNNHYFAYEATLNTVSELGKVRMVAMDKPEFRLGSPSMIVLETPGGGAQDWMFLVGSIDMFFYNYGTGKLVICEAKSGFSEAPAHSNSKLYMVSKFLKEKHVKQLTLYAWMLINMSQEAGVPIDPTDIELVILADDRSKRRSEIWLFGYHPKTFLGSVWAFDRWTGLIDTGLLVHQRQRTLKCAFCETEDNLIKTKSKPVKFVCRQCYSINRCACGALVRFTYAGKRVCGRQCPKLFNKTPPATIVVE